MHSFRKIKCLSPSVTFNMKCSSFMNTMLSVELNVPLPVAGDFIVDTNVIDKIRERLELDSAEWKNLQWVSSKDGQTWIAEMLKSQEVSNA